MTLPISIRRISVDQAPNLLARPNILVLDARDSAAFERGRSFSATRVSSDTVIHLIGKTPKFMPILIYCHHGKASQEYARMFVDFGFTEVYSLDGGFEAWRQWAQAGAKPPASTVGLGNAARAWLAEQGFSEPDWRARTDEGMTPLMVACRLGNLAIAAELLHAGASLDTRNADGNTALWMACVGGAVEVVDLLLSSGSDLNNQNDNGATCLMYAASKGNTSLAARLISAGADLSRQTLDGYTALDMAATRECLDLLRFSDSRTIPANR